MITINDIFGRVNQNGNVDILYTETGESITRIDFIDNLYPVNSNLSTHWEHPNGIELSIEGALRVGIEIEN
ncbi:hypothetical protein [Xenorhabdus sp. IM139775]|uniref:hypothetical protein n=1 Tax=Xenorhabdus sp. IM139775 TaxID=3025876 RepID=UPI002359CEE9|nr:hypothetical protein [Xenorhabdus sp. IM139775]MDC9592761.1 hypothetical protein [Xenorhabdus sp. IM139775]MDC9594180.1 hypothetical protein [Xenorhabdus sp. IM139775]